MRPLRGGASGSGRFPQSECRRLWPEEVWLPSRPVHGGTRHRARTGQASGGKRIDPLKIRFRG